ncbi:DUF397 domain-containing protein [Streptomyces lydicus]|uniref:DUF397 domain-containing protein n=1 Tax=Streptomyces lydicus TaxID=47763 RepID=UPI0033F69477
MKDLYSLPAAQDNEFKSLCGGNLNGEHESCVDVAALPGVEGAFAVRDNKPEGAGIELRFTAGELDDFARGWAQKRGLAL